MRIIKLFRLLDPREWIWWPYKWLRHKAWKLRDEIRTQKNRLSEVLEQGLRFGAPNGPDRVLAGALRARARQIEQSISQKLSIYHQLIWTAQVLRSVYNGLHFSWRPSHP